MQKKWIKIKRFGGFYMEWLGCKSVCRLCPCRYSTQTPAFSSLIKLWSLSARRQRETKFNKLRRSCRNKTCECFLLIICSSWRFLLCDSQSKWVHSDVGGGRVRTGRFDTSFFKRRIKRFDSAKTACWQNVLERDDETLLILSHSGKQK